MATSRHYSDDELAELRSAPKRVTNPGAHWKEKPGHRQRNFRACDQQDDSVRFSIYQRQSLHDDNDFSCGIEFIPRVGARLTLARYNGPSHRHGEIVYRPHIHRTTATAIAAGKKPESEADETDRYTNLEGALRCLVEDFHLKGLSISNNNQASLFNGP